MKKNTVLKTLSLFLCLILCLGLLSGCETWNNFRKAFIDPPQPEVFDIKIGILEPQTGRQSYDAEDEVAGMELAHEMFPSAGGYDIVLLYEDNRSNTDICKEAAQKLIDRGSCVILGSVSDTLSLAASDVINENQVPAIAATCTVPILTKTNPYYLRVNVINSFDAEGASEYAYDVLEARSVVVLLPEGNDFAQTKAEVFETDFVEHVGYDTFEYTYTEIDETGKEVEKKDMTPTVYYLYINGSETQDTMDYVFREMDKVGCYTFYCPCDSNTALPWILAAQEYEFQDSRKEADEFPYELTTMSYTDENGNVVEEVGYWDQWGNWVKYVAPEENPSEEPTEEKKFTWIGTNLWQGIETNAASIYGTTYMLANVCYTLSYDSTISQSEMADAFLKAYHEKYGSDAVPSDNFALGFDSYLLAYEAISKVIETSGGALPEEGEAVAEGSSNSKSVLFDSNKVFNRSLLTNALYKTKNLMGATGTITIDENGDPTKDIIIEAFDGYEFKAVYTAYPGNLVKDGE